MKAFSVFLCTLLLAACSSQPIKLYSGPERPAEQLAVVKLPVELELLSINGKPVDAPFALLGMGDRQLQLLPGRYQLLVFYENIWETSGDSHTTIQSKPVTLTMTLETGHTYQVSFNEAQSIEQARAFEEQFQARLTDLASGQQVTSQASGLKLDNSLFNQLTGQTQAVAASTPSQQTITPLATVSPSAKPTSNAVAVGYLDLLKAQWQQASQAEKRAFLKWISSHP